jgi:hypothetical protein
MAHGEVEQEVWKPAVAATKRYFRGIMERCTVVEQIHYRTGYIMGYRAGLRLGRRRASEGKSE